MTNNERADKVLDIIRKHYGDETETDIIDLLTDTRHLCLQQGLDYKKLNNIAEHHHEVESCQAKTEIERLKQMVEDKDRIIAQIKADLNNAYETMNYLRTRKNRGI